MRKSNSRLLFEAKKDLELAVTKALNYSRLRPEELQELLLIDEADLMRDYGCDLYMAERVKQHTKQEQYRLRTQNLYTSQESTEELYPEKPYTRTSPINESSVLGRTRDHRRVICDSREVRTAKGALHNIAVDAGKLHRLLNDEDDLPQWCEYKIAQARLMTESVREYLEHKLGGHDD